MINIHDVRNYINSISGFVGLARKHADDQKKLTEYLGKAEEAAAALKEMLDELEASESDGSFVNSKPDKDRLGAIDLKRILIAEDMEINRELAEIILKETGYLVDSVPDGIDAIEAVKRHAPTYYDMILMDIEMPIMGGYDAARLIRKIGREDTSTIPIIAVSGNVSDEDKRKALENGMNAHISKPFNVEEMIATIKEYI